MKNPERDEEIKRLKREGARTIDLAAQFHLSKRRIREICSVPRLMTLEQMAQEQERYNGV